MRGVQVTPRDEHELHRLRREQAIDRERIEALEDALAELRAIVETMMEAA